VLPPILTLRRALPAYLPACLADWPTHQAGTESVSSDDSFSFHVIVRDQNMDKLKAFVAAASDPRHAMYGQAMTADEVSVLTAPSAKDTRTVTQWLEQVKICGPESMTDNQQPCGGIQGEKCGVVARSWLVHRPCHASLEGAVSRPRLPWLASSCSFMPAVVRVLMLSLPLRVARLRPSCAYRYRTG
jgi:hypothetical protein